MKRKKKSNEFILFKCLHFCVSFLCLKLIVLPLRSHAHMPIPHRSASCTILVYLHFVHTKSDYVEIPPIFLNKQAK